MAEARHWLAGRLAVVTGASRGIGAATAQAIAAAGAHVVLAARDGEALDAVASRIRDEGGAATAVPTDVSQIGEVDRLFATVEAAGPLGALVCAAGVLTRALFADTTADTWDRTLAVNLTGPLAASVATTYDRGRFSVTPSSHRVTAVSNAGVSIGLGR